MNMHSPTSPQSAAPYDFAAGRETTPGGDAPKSRRWIWALLVVAIILGVIVAWRTFGTTKPAPAEAAKLPQVTVVVPGSHVVADEIRVTGQIAARRDMPVGVQGEGGLITAVLVDAGQFVKAGQVLARIDRSVQVQQVAQMAASIRSAQADAALGQAELDRAGRLVGKGFISKADIDRKTATRDANLARVTVAKAQLGEMQARLARLDVRAPAAGLVLARAVEAGQVVNPSGTALFRIAEGGILEMRAQVAEQDLARLKVGLPAAVQPVGAATSYRGRIWLIDPVIDNASRQGIARIALNYSPGLRVGAFANATIGAGEATQPVLPQSAVQVDDVGNFVYVVEPDGSVARRAVTVASVRDNGVGIARGLTGAEKIVVSAGAFLRPGEKVIPVSAPKR